MTGEQKAQMQAAQARLPAMRGVVLEVAFGAEGDEEDFRTVIILVIVGDRKFILPAQPELAGATTGEAAALAFVVGILFNFGGERMPIARV